jgi:phage-related protein (TIGR01555 family)
MQETTSNNLRIDSYQLARAFGGLLHNRMSGLGTGRDKTQYTEINPFVRSLTEQELSGLYRKSGVLQRAVSIYPQDAKQIWCKLNFANDIILPEQIFNYAKQLGLRDAIALASLYSRWFGDGYILMGIADGNEASEEVDRDRIKSIRWLKVLSRWEMRPIRPSSNRWEDVKMYEFLALSLPDNARYWHSSRVLRFSGVRLDRYGMAANNGSHDSVIQSMYESFCAYYPGVQSLSIMVQDHRLRMFGVRGLASTNKDELVERAMTNDLTRSTAKVEIYDLDNESISNLTNNYSGIDKAIERLEECWSSDTDVSRVVLFNQLGKTALTSGEAFRFARLDHAYRLNSWQENVQRSPLENFFTLLMRSQDSPTKGKLPDGWSLSFPLNYRMTVEEELTVQKMAGERDEKYIALGVYDAATARRQFEASEFDHNITLEETTPGRTTDDTSATQGTPGRTTEDTSASDWLFRTDSAWGVWFGGRRTPICVEAGDRSEAISKARKKKKRGGDNVDTARLLTDSERKIANSGGWVRSGAKHQPPGYNKSKRGFGPEPRKDSIPQEIVDSAIAAIALLDSDPTIQVDSKYVEMAEAIVFSEVDQMEWKSLFAD